MEKKDVSVTFEEKEILLKLKIFSLGFSSEGVRRYVKSVENLFFKPHRTSYSLEGDEVFLEQRLSLNLGPQGSLKGAIYDFLKLSRYSSNLLKDQHIEELKLKIGASQLVR